MQRKEGGSAAKDRGRRPLLSTFDGNNRQMLLDIKDSLNHVRRPDQGQLSKSELSQSTPNLLDKPNGNTTNHKMSRFGYNQMAMAEIRKTLEGLEVHDGLGPPNHRFVHGLDIESMQVNKKMLQQLMSMGADEDVATRALKLSRNKGVDAALEIIQKLSQHEGRNGFTIAANTGLQGYGSKVIRKPSFEEKYRQSSPVNSENSSLRSESPSLGRHSYMADPLRQTMHHQTNLTVPGHHQQMMMATERQSPPPPLPPRGLSNPVPNSQSGPAPPPVPPQTYKVLNNNSYAPPPALSRRMSPVSRDSPYRGMPVSSQPSPANSTCSGPVTPQRGMSPSSGYHQPVIKQQQQQQQQQQQNLCHPSSHDYRAQGLLPSGPPTVPLEDSGYASSGSSSQGPKFSYRNPPPYTHVLPNKPQQPFYNEQNSVAVNQLQGNNSSPLSSHSPSPAPTPQSHSPMVHSAGPSPKQPVPVQAWNAKQPPIIMQQVKSREVSKPVLQTATAPLSPPPQYAQQGGGVMLNEQQQNQYSYITEVSTRVNQPHLQVNLPSAQSHSNAAHQFYSQMQQQQLQQQQQQQQQQQLQQQQQQQHQHQQQHQAGHSIHSVQIRKGCIEHVPSYQTAQNGQGQSSQLPNGRTINIHIENNGSANHTIQVLPGYGVTHYGQDQRVPPLHPMDPSNRFHQTDTPGSTPRSRSPISSRVLNNQSPLSVISTNSTPSTNSDIPDKPPPPYPGKFLNQQIQQPQTMVHMQYTIPYPQANGACSETSSTTSSNYASSNYTDVKSTTSSNYTDISRLDIPIQEEPCNTPPPRNLPPPPEYPHPQPSKTEKTPLVSPKPIRKAEAKKKDEERRMSKVRNYSPQAFKFYIEQHVENVLKSHQQRIHRRMQLENEMSKVGLSEEAQSQMRKMLNQKESNYIRLKRAKMDKSMFDKIKTLGIGAFGEVALVRKKDSGALYAMKTLRKQDVLQRNQAAHVKAERDILAEADNEWVVKLYYSFQDKTNLYFVMDYIPGGDMMSLLIKKGIFEEPLAQFYIAELVLAIESVHAMGFIHRDIKPDNILIDKDGHIKLTDFGLCTGFRWTHDSKYYQKGNHARQDSMEPDESWGNVNNCQCTTKEVLKPLERRKLRHQRCLAHSLVGTPNYIAPEVLERSGYTKVCDWWSVGVILYEMLVGQPPFMANTPAETQMKVINWQQTLHIPPEAQFADAACDFILRLCCSPDNRLGVNGAGEIKQHPFFSNITFETLRRQEAPYIPKIRYQTDTSNFDPVDPEKIRSSGSCDSLDTLKHDGTGGNGKHPDHAFFEFTFRRFFDDGGHPYPAAKLTEANESNGPVYV